MPIYEYKCQECGKVIPIYHAQIAEAKISRSYFLRHPSLLENIHHRKVRPVAVLTSDVRLRPVRMEERAVGIRRK